MASKGKKIENSLIPPGAAYQIHVLMLLYEKAFTNETFTNFRLYTEWKPAEKFDDAVLSWTCNQSATQNWLFVQVKHKQKVPSIISEQHLFDESPKAEFSLHKYLNSFWEIKQNSRLQGNKQFVIYSNGTLEGRIQHWFSDVGIEDSSVLKSSQNGQFRKLNASAELVQKMLIYGNKDFNELSETIKSILLKGENDFDVDLFKKYRSALNCKVLQVVDKSIVKFAKRFIDKKDLTYSEHLLRQRLFAEEEIPKDVQLSKLTPENEELIKVLTSKGDSCNKLPPSLKEDDVIEFLDQLILAVNQPSDEDLEDVIKNDLGNILPMKNPGSKDDDIERLYNTLHKVIFDWLNGKNETPFKGKIELEEKFQAVYKTIRKTGLDLYKDNFQTYMESLRIGFSESNLHLSSPLPMAVVTSTEQGLLTYLKLYQNLRESHYRYFSLKALQVSSSIRQELHETMIASSSGYYLVLKDDSTKFEFSTQLLDDLPACNRIKLILLTSSGQRASAFFNERQFTLYHDNDNSFNRLDLRSQQMLMDRTVLFQGVELPLGKLPGYEVFREEILEALIRGKTIELGPELPQLKLKHYIPRTISCCDGYNYSEEKFLEWVPLTFTYNSVFVLSSTPGMGKTTLWTRLALLAKNLEKSNWILHIKLSDCVIELMTLNKNSKLKHATEFLLNVTQLKMPFERSWFSHCVQNIPNCTYIFFDGFDEIPYETTRHAISLLRILQATTRVFVNTRTHQQAEIEQSLGVDAFFLQPINKQEQKSFFKSFYDISISEQSGIGPLTGFLDQLIDYINSKSMEMVSKVVGDPLVLSMLAEVYKPYIQSFRATGDAGILGDLKLTALDTLDLFEDFMYSTFKRQNIEKLNLDVTNPHIQIMLDESNFFYKGFVKLHSFLGLVSLVKQKQMNLIVCDKRELSMLETQADILESAVIRKYSNGIPYFIHASLAEFFAAKCLFDYLGRMTPEQVESNFIRSSAKRIASKKRKVKNVYDIYLKVLKDNRTVRQFFFQITKKAGDFVGRLLRMLWCMRPYPLLWACEERFEQLARRLIEDDPAIVRLSRAKNRNTALHCAVARENPIVCMLLIDNDADINAVNVRRQTALHLAALNGCDGAASMLISQGANINAVDCNLQTPLMMAAREGYTKVVQLLASNVDCNVNCSKKGGWNALHIAAFNGHTDIVEILIDKKSLLKVEGASKWLCLLEHLVARKFNKLVEMLVEYEVKTCSRESDLKQTLCWALKRDNLDIIRTMQQAGANIHVVDENSGFCSYRFALSKKSFNVAVQILHSQNCLDVFDYPLHAAAEAGCFRCVSIILFRKVGVNMVNENGMTPLDLALKHGHYDAAQILLNASAVFNHTSLHAVIKANWNHYKVAMFTELLLCHGADANAADKNGWTPLHLAAVHCNVECTMYLFLYGAYVSAKDTAGRTPLHLAAAHGSAEIMVYLTRDQKILEHTTVEQYIDEQDNEGQTALHEACANKQLPTVLELIRLGANVNCVNTKQQTPAHLAAMGGLWYTIQELLKGKADIYAEDNQGMTHLDYAALNGHLEYVEMFLNLRPAIYHKFDLERAQNLAGQNGHVELANILGVHTNLDKLRSS